MWGDMKDVVSLTEEGYPLFIKTVLGKYMKNENVQNCTGKI